MIYEFKCVDCGAITDASRSVANRNDTPKCDCGGETRRLITGGAGFTPILGAANVPGYLCPVTDTFVTSRRQRREIMARHDLVERG